MRLPVIFFAALLATPASAGVEEALKAQILPGFDAFAEAAVAVEGAAAADCRAEAVAPAWQAAFDAWMAVADLRLGPSESGALSIAFWPDDRGFTRRTLARLVADKDAVALDPAAYAHVSIAARGLFALEMLLYDPEFAAYDAGSYTCTLVRTVATDLARQAAMIGAAWSDEFAGTLATAGEPGNTTFLTGDEAFRALYTQLLAGLEFTADARLGRPLGTFERPRPKRAEAWRSGRSLRDVTLAADAAEALARALAGGEIPETAAAAERVRAAAARVSDPGFQDVTDPQARLRVEILQQAVRGMRAAVETEIGTRLGITPGFNSQDGD